jgi:PAT family acetyl-CoA transporter-like MFS transporter 1
MLYFLVATQDVAVDGWALTMLHRDNVGLASNVNSAGLTLGYIISYAGYTGLSSETFCRSTVRPYLGLEEGGRLVSLAGFMFSTGVLYIISTVIVAVFKKEGGVEKAAVIAAEKEAEDTEEMGRLLDAAETGERDSESEEELDEALAHPHSIKDAYAQLLAIVRLPSVILLATLIITCRMGFTAFDATTSLELAEMGFPREHLVTIGVLYSPIEVRGYQ